MQSRRAKYLLLAAVAALLIIVIAFCGGNTLTLICLPFTAAGEGLRSLSLSGAAGNAAAIVLYIIISLLPLLFLIRRKLQAEDLLLPLCSFTLFYALYYTINPGLRPLTLIGETGTLIYCGCVYSTLLSWGIIKLVRYCDSVGVRKIYQAMRILLLVCCLGCLWIGFGTGFLNLLADIKAVQLENTMPNLNLLPTYTVRGLAYIVWALEYGLDALVLLFGVKLLYSLEQEPYSAASCRAAEKTACWCKISLIVIVLAHTLLNLLQMLMADQLHTLAVNFRIPVLSIAIVFAMLALTRLLGQGRELKEDNDLFI